MSPLLSRLAGGLVAALLLIQLVPYGHAHTNPKVIQEPAWDSPATRALVVRACFDCHSNETKWPWYSNVAPLSWLVQDHVDEGRETMNFSEWNKPAEDADEAGEVVEEGEMPIPNYLWLHPEANLSVKEKAALIAGLNATLGGEAGEGAERHGKGGDRDGDDD